MPLIANILRSDSPDASLDGISSKATKVIIDNVAPEMTFPPEVSEKYPHVNILKRVFGIRVLFHAEPAGKFYRSAEDGSYIAGGTFIHSSDYRFSEAIANGYAAIPLHDRFETWDMLGGMD